MKIKRTYNLSADSIATVKRLAEEEHIASSQDAVVEQAIAELDRLVRESADARLWSQAVQDQEFQAEVRQITTELPADNLDRWE